MDNNFFEEQGIPLAQQFRNWNQLNIAPYNKIDTSRHIKSKILILGAMESQLQSMSRSAISFKLPRQVQQQLSLLTRIEQQQLVCLEWLIPADESIYELALSYEQAAISLYGFFAENEENTYLKRAMELFLVESIDHLYRLANLIYLLDEQQADACLKNLVNIMPGAASIAQHRHPIDDLAEPLTLSQVPTEAYLALLILLSLELKLNNFYTTLANRLPHPLARGLFLEVAELKLQHVVYLSSLLNPKLSFQQNYLLHQYAECYLYNSFLADEDVASLKSLWETHLSMEIEHLQIVSGWMQRQKSGLEEILPRAVPRTIDLSVNLSYIRMLQEAYSDSTLASGEFVNLHDLTEESRYRNYINMMNVNGSSPSEQVLRECEVLKGTAYQSTI